MAAQVSRRRSVALVESPTQLLNALEWAFAAAGGERAQIIVLAPSDPHGLRQIEAVAARAESLDVDVEIAAVRRRGPGAIGALTRIAAAVRRADRLVVGDPFSGMIQGLLVISKAAELVVVDDGTATWEFHDCIEAGRPLQRWRLSDAPAGRLATRAARRLTPGPGRRLSVFSCFASGAAPTGAELVRNDYAWTRSRWAGSVDADRTDVLGVSLADNGMIDRAAYLAAVGALAARFGAVSYHPHRRESAETLSALASIEGVQIVRGELPIELTLTSGPVAARVVAFPSTAAYTLPIVLAGSGVTVLLRRIEPEWFTAGTGAHARAFIARIADDAGLADAGPADV